MPKSNKSGSILYPYFFVFFSAVSTTFAEPIVLTGSMLPRFLGQSIQSIRVRSHNGNCIPFQIDEVDTSGDYICPQGAEPNKGNGVLDTSDEIVFMFEDADTSAGGISNKFLEQSVCVMHNNEKRFVIVSSDSALPPSKVSYIKYDHSLEKLITPNYYACFGHERFHFTSAGVMDFTSHKFLDLTSELRIRIICKWLWGLIPITYTENSIICLVKRYKAGAIRLIRRGDFHLNLGLFVKGSHAAVNQICYPDMVRVPVYVHLPIRLGAFFSEAYLEMSPVIKPAGNNFTFEVPKKGISFGFNGHPELDTLVTGNPNYQCMITHDKSNGYAWLLEAAMEDKYLHGSGYIFSSKPSAKGPGYAGFRLTVRDLPQGQYLIGNWVLFSKTDNGSLLNACKNVSENAKILVDGEKEIFKNQLNKVQKFRKK